MREKTNHEKLQMVRDLIYSFEIEEYKAKHVIAILESALDLRGGDNVVEGEIYPDFVKMGDTTLRYEGAFEKGHQYQRVAGNWYVTASYVDGKLVANSDHPYLDHVVNLPLIKCTEEEWRQDNIGYIDESSHAFSKNKLSWADKRRQLAEDEDNEEPPF